MSVWKQWLFDGLHRRVQIVHQTILKHAVYYSKYLREVCVSVCGFVYIICHVRFFVATVAVIITYPY